MCTTMIVTPAATADGSMIVAHSDDDELSDQRIVSVPATDHAAGAQRAVLPERYLFPRIVSDQRGRAYDTPEYPATQPVGHIPQVPHTYAYVDGNYGIVNEHNLMIGECTNGAKYQPAAVRAEESAGSGRHQRIFYSSELSRVALERCTGAREAVELMGALIDAYGYYSEGETLLVADAREAWVLEMCALPDEEYHSAWVAQRVPDGTVFVAANQFRIRQVRRDDPDQICSAMLHRGAEKLGWWRPSDGALDWAVTVSYGEYNHPYYSLRRVWRVFDRVSPDLGLSPWVEDGYTTAYPFSVQPARPLTVPDVFALYRDHYEGTQFDMTRDAAAGPWGDPTRVTGSYDGSAQDLNGARLYGAWERPISVYYQGYTYVNQLRPGDHPLRGVTWLAPDVSYTSCFVPLPTAVRELPWSYQSGSPSKLDRNAAWWAFDFVANWARLNFQRMTRVDILPLQQELEALGRARLAEWDATCRSMDPAQAEAWVTKACHEHAQEVLRRWWEMADTLVARYADSYINRPGRDAVGVGYPSTWLVRTNYADGPTSYAMKP
jgi:dipeptidase